MKIGLISDTHNYIDPRLWEIFAGVDIILHAGDSTSEEALIELKTIAPVHAVRGNSDDYSLIRKLPEHMLIQLENHYVYVVHILGSKREFLFRLRHHQIKETPSVVVFGHVHEASATLYDQMVFINPGCAGKQRAKGMRSVALLELEKNVPPRYHFITL